MSARSTIFGLSSLEPVRGAIASSDEDLVDAVIRQDSSNQDLAEFANDMILCSPPPDDEPGCWSFVITALIEHFGLSTARDLALNEGWKHFDTWENYRSQIESCAGEECLRLLRLLEHGRPFLGKRVVADGTLFAWLDDTEVATLCDALSELDEDIFSDAEIGMFHEALLRSLEQIKDKSSSLVLTAT